MLPGGVFSESYRSELAIVRTRTQWVYLVLGIAFLFVIPLLTNTYWVNWLTGVCITIIIVLGMHILSGLCGQISMGQAAFVAVGAYVTAILTTRWGINAWLCAPIATLAAGIVGLFFGLPCFRLKGFYLVVSTMGASFIIGWILQNWETVTGGYTGLGVHPLQLGSIDFGNRSTFFYLTVVVMILATVFAKNIQRTSTGRAFVAIRDGEAAARFTGISVFRYKLLAFFIGCLFAGVAGWLFAFNQQHIAPDQFRLLDSMWYLGMIAVGGWGNTSGVFFGVVFLKGLDLMLTDYVSPALADAFPAVEMQLRVSLSVIVNGLVIVAFIIFQRHGMVYLWEKLKMFWRLHPYSYWKG